MRASLALVVTLAGLTAVSARASAERPRGRYVVTPAEPRDSAKPVPGGPMHRIIYLNRHGGTFTPGPNNSSTNTSSIPDVVSTIAPWNKGDQRWQELMTCARAMFDRFDITVTDVDPGDAAHVEAVVGGKPGDVQQGSNVGGVSPMLPDCSVIERSIVYIFDVWGNNIQDICDTVAQETMHSYGLDHEFLCEDPMTYLVGCGPKSFQDANAACGEYGPRVCYCGMSFQNSVQTILGLVGTSDPVPPTVAIVEPADGADVKPRFTVVAAPQDDQRINRVQFFVDGERMVTLTAEPWSYTTRRDLAFGPHTLEAKAFDRGENEASASIAITLVTECSANGECADGEECASGRCAVSLGNACAGHDDCLSGSCVPAPDTGDLTCTQTCSAGAACPSGFACASSGGLCWASGGGGGCSAVTGGGDHTGGAAMALLLVAIALAGRPRRARR